MTNELLMEARDVSVTFGGGVNTVKAVQNCSLTLRAGEPIGIVGESGSGKSTLARVLAGLQAPTGGEVLFRGNSVFKGSKSYQDGTRNQVQMVFQDPYGSLNPQLTGLSAVAEAVRIHKKLGKEESEANAMELLQRMGIGKLDALKKPRQLSGGQRQRVAVARALVNKPSIILADEPTGNLDSKTSVEIMNLFNEIHANGNTVILVTHEEDIAAYAHRIIRLRDGIIESDTRNIHTKE